METPPVPKPRLNVSEYKYSANKILKTTAKKPIPLPRHKTINEQNYRYSEIDDGSSEISENRTCRPTVTTESKEGSNKMQCNKRIPSKNLKEEWEVPSDDVHFKAKAVIENTKNVGARIEKSVRNITRRLTVRSASPNKGKELISVPKVSRSQSLPSEDIFQSISFHSPFTVDHVLQDPPVTCEGTLQEDDNLLAGAPPPVYPPPPLPDESVYDEVHSVVSSHSSGYEAYCDSDQGIDALYEDISFRKNRECKDPDVPIKSNSETCQSSVLNKPKFISRSDSWNFYDVTPEKDICHTSTADKYNLNSTDIFACNSTSNSAAPVSSSVSVLCQKEIEHRPINSDELSSCESYSDTAGQIDRPTPRKLSIQNELYEKWETASVGGLPSRPIRSSREKRHNLPTKSVILEFDPLYEKTEDTDHTSLQNQKSNTEFTFLDKTTEPESPYGRIMKVNGSDECEEEFPVSENDELICPPVPPRRYDSINITADIKCPSVNETSAVTSKTEGSDVGVMINDVESQSVTSDLQSAEEKTEAPLEETELAYTDINKETLYTSNVPGKNRKTALVRWASMKRAIQLMADSTSRRRISKEPPVVEAKSDKQNATFYGEKSDTPMVVERPKIVSRTIVHHSGVLYQPASYVDRARDFVHRHCVLAEGKLSCFSDKTGTSINDVIPLDRVVSIQGVLEHKIGPDGEDLHFFEVNVSWKKGYSYLFGVSGSTERRIWMQKLLESLTTVFPIHILIEYTRAGWCYLKEGVSGNWTSGWVLVQRRTLFYCIRDGTLQEADLRKARCIVLQDSKLETTKLSVTEKGPLILVDIPGQSLYLQMDVARETVGWHSVIRAAALDNGLHLAQQQLTREEIPTIVDKCINFVYAHGSMSEGIYRRSGANSSVTRLLTLFRQDAWAVQLTRQEYSEYDVASVLKRFLRDLPEPLLTTELHPQLCEIAAGKRGSSRMVHYRRVLEQLPPINYLTVRKLIGHLHFIHEQHEKNLMPVENLAAIWGPTLLHVEGADDLNWSKQESGVISDLILLYSEIFGVDAAELSREKRMQEVLERYHTANSSAPQNKPSGDLKIWIHIGNRDSSNCVSVTVGPQKLAGEVCTELSNKISLSAHEICLEEVVCGGALNRPLHHTERVLDVVLRWSYWDDVDRKDNYLVLCKNTIVKEAASQAKYPMALCGDLRFADCKSRTFKTFLFEFSQAKLCYYKDKRGSMKLGEWKIEDIVWYLGYEPKRNPQMRWAITFIDKNKKPLRSKENPYFGYTIAGVNKEEQVRWIGAMLAGEYPQNLLPSPVLLQ